MNWTDASQHWPAMTDAIVTRWPALTRADVSAVDGDRTAMIALLADRLDLTPREAEDEIAELVAGPMPADAVMQPTEDNDQISASRAHIPAGEDVYSEDGDFGDDRLAERPLGRSGTG